ncbi:MAG: hypothetical protein ACRCY4_09155 [Brevinema sp.]
MRVLRYSAVLLILVVVASCAKKAKPTPAPAPAIAEAPAQTGRVMLTVRVRVAKGDLRFTPEVFNRARKQLRDQRGSFVANSTNATMGANAVTIDLSVPYMLGTATNLNVYRYYITDRDAASTAFSSPFAVQIRAQDVTSVSNNHMVTTQVYPVTWGYTNSGK